MSIDLYGKYIEEREGRLLISLVEGFVTYSKLDNNTYYLVDMYVQPQFRKLGIAWKLNDLVCEVARKDNATKLLTSVCTSANGVTESLHVVLAGGFRFSSASGDMLFFVKDI